MAIHQVAGMREVALSSVHHDAAFDYKDFPNCKSDRELITLGISAVGAHVCMWAGAGIPRVKEVGLEELYFQSSSLLLLSSSSSLALT